MHGQDVPQQYMLNAQTFTGGKRDMAEISPTSTVISKQSGIVQSVRLQNIGEHHSMESSAATQLHSLDSCSSLIHL